MEIYDKIKYRNPNLIVSRIDDSFFTVTNPFINNGIKVINSAQKTVLDLINGKETTRSIAKKLGYSENDVSILMDILEEKQFVSDDNSFNEQHWKKQTSTLNFWIQTTNDCNLRCSYCYIHTLGKKDFIKDVDIDRFINKVVETAKKRNLKLVQLRFAGGEPFLKISLWESKIPLLKQRLQDIDCKLNIVILTNLVALNEHLMDLIKSNSITIAVSIDGIGKYHDGTRHFKDGKGCFDIIEKNIDRLIYNGTNPVLMTVVSNSNLDGIEEFTRYIIEKNLKNRYSFVSGEDIDMQKLITKMRVCYEIFEDAIEKGYKFSSLHKLCDLKFDKLSFQTCSSGYDGGALYTDGSIYFCQRHFGITQPLGSVYEKDDLLTIIQRKTFYGEISADCKSCRYKFICTSGCPVERINRKDPHCAAYKVLIPIILRLRGKERLIKIEQIINE